MSYFKKVEVGDKVFGLVFGLGEVSTVFDESSHYRILVEFKNDFEVPYTSDGVPGWGKFNEQTLFFKEDIDLTQCDFSPINKILTPKKIIKLRDKKRLEVRMPSGIWRVYDKQIKLYTQELLEDMKYHLFRKKIEA